MAGQPYRPWLFLWTAVPPLALFLVGVLGMLPLPDVAGVGGDAIAARLAGYQSLAFLFGMAGGLLGYLVAGAVRHRKAEGGGDFTGRVRQGVWLVSVLVAGALAVYVWLDLQNQFFEGFMSVPSPTDILRVLTAPALLATLAGSGGLSLLVAATLTRTLGVSARYALLPARVGGRTS